MHDHLSVNCPVCFSASGAAIALCRHSTAIFTNCDLTSCNNCGIVYASSMPENSDIEDYNANYFQNAHGGIPTDPLTTSFHRKE
jgi:hypothetical protein